VRKRKKKIPFCQNKLFVGKSLNESRFCFSNSNQNGISLPFSLKTRNFNNISAYPLNGDNQDLMSDTEYQGRPSILSTYGATTQARSAEPPQARREEKTQARMEETLEEMQKMMKLLMSQNQRLTDRVEELQGGTTEVARSILVGDDNIFEYEHWPFATIQDPLARQNLISRLKRQVLVQFERSQASYAVANDRAAVEQLGDYIEHNLLDYLNFHSIAGDNAPYPGVTLPRFIHQLRYIYHKHREGTDAAEVWKNAMRSSTLPKEFTQAEKEVRTYLHDRNVVRAGNGGGRGSGGLGRGGPRQRGRGGAVTVVGNRNAEATGQH
jgi:hypothetical protein